MRNCQRRCVALVLAGGLWLVPTGCTESTLSAEAQLCDSISQLRDATAALGSLDLGSTRAELRETVDGIAVALGAVSEDLGAVVQGDVDAIQASFDEITRTVQALPTDAGLAEVLTTVEQALPALQAAVAEIGDNVDCSGTA
jgi:hypothetical protein